jgi:sensor histidine kinase regulating citrate/malate metabolism
MDSKVTSANTPLGVVLKVALVVLGVELAIMLAIENLQPVFGDQVAPVFWTFLDPILLTIIVASALYVFVFRSMQLQQAELRRQYDALRVAAITFEVHDAIIITDAIGNIIRVNGFRPPRQGFPH